MKTPRAIYLLILFATLTWCCAIVGAPLLVATPGGARGIGTVLYRFFHVICHQYPDRSLHVAGEPLAVCSRCSAIYVAFLTGVVMFPLVRRLGAPGPSRRTLFVAALPMFLDVLLGYLGMHETTNTTRLITGGAFGLAASIAILPDAIHGAGALISSFIQTRNSLSKGSPNATET